MPILLAARYKTTGDDAYRMLRAILTTPVADGLFTSEAARPMLPSRSTGSGSARKAIGRPGLFYHDLRHSGSLGPPRPECRLLN